MLIRDKLNETPASVPAHFGNRSSDASEVCLSIWSAQAQKTQTVWSAKSNMTQILDVGWLHGTTTALARIRFTRLDAQGEPTNQVAIVRITAQGKMDTVATAADNSELVLYISPSSPYALLLRSTWTQDPRQGSRSLSLLRSDGSQTPPIALATPMHIQSVDWRSDSAPVIQGSMRDPTTKEVGFKNLAIDFKSGATSFVENRPPSKKPVETGLALRTSRIPLTGGKKPEMISQLWLQGDLGSELPEALVAGDVGQGSLSPAKDAVFFVTRGIGMVRQLTRLPRDRFLIALLAAQKMDAMLDAKMAGLAMVLYLVDHDDTYPVRERTTSCRC